MNIQPPLSSPRRRIALCTAAFSTALLLMTVIYFAPARAADPPPADFSLERLGLADQTALGAAPVLNVFVPGPGDHHLAPSGSYFDLIFSHSPLLQARDSVMTVLLNDSELTAIRLAPENASRTFIRLPLPHERIVPAVNTLSLRFLMRTQDECEEPSNPALYTRVHRESVIHWEYAEGAPLKTPTLDLARFPYPLMREGHTRGGGVLFVLPADPTHQELSAAATLAATMARLGRMEEPRYEVIAADRFQPSDGAGNDLVVVGTSRSNPLVEQIIGARLPNTGAGVVRLALSPFDGQRAALVVTGETDEAAMRASFALADQRTRAGLSGDTAVVRELDIQLAPFPPEDPDIALTLLQPGQGNITTTGTGATPLGFTFTSPSPTQQADARLRLWLSHSAVMDERRSTIRLTLNGTAIASIRLDESNRERTAVDLLIAQRSLRPGVNRLQMDFNLHLPTGSDNGRRCADFATERAWVTLYQDSNISIDGGPPPATPDIAHYPYPFVRAQGMKGTLIVAGGDTESLREGLLTAAALGRRNRALSDAIGMTTPYLLTDGQRISFVLLAVGRPTQNPLLRDLAATMPLRFQEGTDRVLLDRNAVIAAVEDAGNTGVYQVGFSIYNNRIWAGMITGATITNLRAARGALERPRARGRVMLARTAEDATDLQLEPEAVELARAEQGTSAPVLPLITLAVVLASAGAAGWWVYSVSRRWSGAGGT